MKTLSFVFSIEDWTFFEPWDSLLNTFLLSDGDLNTCLDLSDAPPIHMLKIKAFAHYEFFVNVVLKGSHGSHLREMIKVLTSEDEIGDNDSSLDVTWLKECDFTEGNGYFCVCGNNCQLFVRITTESSSVENSEMLAVCEILITN